MLRWLDRVTKLSSVVLGALAKTSVTSVPAFAAATLTSIQTGFWIPAALIVAPSVAWVRAKVDNSKLDEVHALLNQIRKETFKNETFDLEQHARVTLFRYKPFVLRRWPFFGGWLVPVERSGELTRKTSAVFRAHDNGEKCEGVVGRTWARRKSVLVQELPDLKTGPTSEDFDKYAKESFMTASDLRKKLPHAQSLYGLPVEVSGKGWGVIVIDSIHPRIRYKSADSTFKQLSSTLESYLKGL